MRGIDTDRVDQLFAQGLTVAVIATRLGCTSAAVCRYLKKKHGTSIPANPYHGEYAGFGGSGGYQSRPHFIEHDDGPGAV